MNVSEEIITEALARARDRISIVIRPALEEVERPLNDPLNLTHSQPWGASVWDGGTSAREWRAVVHLVYAPHDLHALGVDRAHLRWSNAVHALRNFRRAQLAIVERVLAQALLTFVAMRVAEERGVPGFVTREDVAEARLRLGGRQ